MIEERMTAQGAGWRIYRFGRTVRIELDRADHKPPVEINTRCTLPDHQRGSLLRALVAGAYGPIDKSAAIEAMQANW